MVIPSTVLIVLRQSGSRIDEIQPSDPSSGVQTVAEDSIGLMNDLMCLDMLEVCPTIWHVNLKVFYPVNVLHI